MLLPSNSVDQKMKTLDLQELLEFLRQKPTPVMEITLLKRFFPDSKTDVNSLEFFHSHFNLYHYLYRLQELINQGDEEFLYIRLSSTYLFTVPPEGKCCFFDEEIPAFCRAPVSSDSLCINHFHLIKHRESEALPDFQDIRSYYLDEQNYYRMDKEELQRITSGVSQWMASMEEIEESLEVMGLQRNCSLDRIKERYRYLAREYHPDRNDRSDRFHSISRAYNILRKWKENHP